MTFWQRLFGQKENPIESLAVSPSADIPVELPTPGHFLKVGEDGGEITSAFMESGSRAFLGIDCDGQPYRIENVIFNENGIHVIDDIDLVGLLQATRSNLGELIVSQLDSTNDARFHGNVTIKHDSQGPSQIQLGDGIQLMHAVNNDGSQLTIGFLCPLESDSLVGDGNTSAEAIDANTLKINFQNDHKLIVGSPVTFRTYGGKTVGVDSHRFPQGVPGYVTEVLSNKTILVRIGSMLNAAPVKVQGHADGSTWDVFRGVPNPVTDTPSSYQIVRASQRQDGAVDQIEIGPRCDTTAVEAMAIGIGVKNKQTRSTAIGFEQSTLHVNKDAIHLTVNGASKMSIDEKSVFIQGALRLANRRTITSSSSPGEVGEVAWDDHYIYICVGDSLWRRAALAIW